MQSKSGVNKIILVGNIEREPRWHKSSYKQDELCFTLTTSELIKKGADNIEHVEWHHVKIAADHQDLKSVELKKGQLLHVIGKIHTKMWVDEQQVKRYKTEIIALQLQVLNDVKVEMAQSA